MSKQYEINTLDDITKCVTADNIDNFIKDFKSFLEMYISLNELGKAVIAAEGSKPAEHPLEHKGFTWIDDGKHEHKIEFYEKE